MLVLLWGVAEQFFYHQFAMEILCEVPARTLGVCQVDESHFL